MTLGQGHDAFLGRGQSLCRVIDSNVPLEERYGPDTIAQDRQTDGQTDRWTR
jgi:hypothetical protein